MIELFPRSHFLKFFSFFLITALFLFSSCQKYVKTGKDQTLILEDSQSSEALLSQYVEDSSLKSHFIPLKRIYANQKIQLAPGKYSLSNDCSSYSFVHKNSEPTIIKMSHLNLDLLGNLPKASTLQDSNQIVLSHCENARDHQNRWPSNKVKYDLLPGPNEIFIAGKTLKFNFSANKSEDRVISLISLSLLSKLTGDVPNFYVHSASETEKKIIMQAPLNGMIWLYPGIYEVEVNGTHKLIDVTSHILQKISLGLLRISLPENFPFQQRLLKGGQPISAFINNKVLLRLNVSYPVFPGQYKVNLDGSSMEKLVVVDADRISELKTLGSLIKPPVCPNSVCSANVKITIHENKMPFSLMTVPTGLPFLVFAGEYQYSVDGVKGIFKTLPTSIKSSQEESLSFLKIKWEVHFSSTLQNTEFVRIESRSPNLSGKSVDLSSFKPTEVVLPQGYYSLTYYTSQGNTRSTEKHSMEINLQSVNMKEVSVPYYVHSSQNKNLEGSSNDVTETNGLNILSPIKK